MPAYFEQGFSVREPMWHGLGIVRDSYPGREEAIRDAGHDFRVVEMPVGVIGKTETRQADGWKALVKSVPADRRDTDPSHGKILHVAPDTYKVVQNETLWDVVDAICDQPNVRYETAGVLKGGSILWVLALLDEPSKVSGDDSLIYPYILSSTTHDGSGAMKASNVSIRVVCWNTLSMAGSESRRSGREFTFRHTANVMDRIEDAKMALRGVKASHEAFMELAEDLAVIPVTTNQRELFFEQLIPLPLVKGLVTDRVASNVDKARAAVREILDGPTTAEPHRFTAYGLWQAGIEYLDHVRKYDTKDTYFNRCLIKQEAAKTQIASLVREVAKAS